MFKKGHKHSIKWHEVMCNKKLSQEHIDKLVKISKGRKNLPHQGFQKGHSPFSGTEKTRFKKGQIPWNKGKARLNFRGEKHPRWKGGINERNIALTRIEYKIWRSKVFVRDNWTCQTCRKRGDYLEAHHIKKWKNYPELRYEVSNGVTLCLPCHNLTKRKSGYTI